MVNTVSPPVAAVSFSGFRGYRPLSGNGTNGSSSLNSLPFSRPLPFSPLCYDLTQFRHTSASPVASARRRSGSTSTTTRQGKASKKSLPQPQIKKSPRHNKDDDEVDNDDIDEDAFEALFSMLEEDLKNDNLLDDDAVDDITEEDLNKFEKEMEAVLNDIDSLDDDSDEDDDDDDEKEEKIMPKLRNWQLRRLAVALKHGRRKTSIKNLAAELGLDRALVLELLREPPPTLLMLSASIPDQKPETPIEAESKVVEPVIAPESQVTEADESTETASAPVHVMQSRRSSQKRLKKVHLETLERVYNRTKRPTNSMISSIVHVTNLPSKTVVKWFEDKRTEEGIPESRQPYQRSAK